MTNKHGAPARSLDRRKGLHPLRHHQAALFGTPPPKLKLDVSRPAPADLRSLFKDVDDVRVEEPVRRRCIHRQASLHPRMGFIGIEPFVNGMAKALGP